MTHIEDILCLRGNIFVVFVGVEHNVLWKHRLVRELIVVDAIYLIICEIRNTRLYSVSY